MLTRILLVEDDRLIVSSITELLHHEGYEVSSAATQNAAIEAVLRGGGAYSLVLMDIALEQGDGLTACRAIKRLAPELPVIFLTAADDELTCVTGLTLGADDYIAKPPRPRELLARISAALRRGASSRAPIALGPITIDTERARVERDGTELVLSAVEYRLLLLFATNKGRVVTRDEIREALWEDAGTYIEENTLSVYIKRLRDKIEPDPVHPALIRTVRGQGYRA